MKESCRFKSARFKRIKATHLEIKSSRSRNECNDKSTYADDTNIRPSYDTEPMVEVPYTAEYNVFVVETQHFEQPKNMNDTSLMEKVDSNTTPDSSDMCNNEFKDD
ncbi:hypothetical protein Tco_1025359 [Tanacetum coccineum]